MISSSSPEEISLDPSNNSNFQQAQIAQIINEKDKIISELRERVFYII